MRHTHTVTSIRAAAFLLFLMPLLSVKKSHAGDVDVKLTTNNGSTVFSVQDSGNVEVSSVNSDGHAYFTSLNQTGTGGNVILNRSTLQTGSTFFVAVGTVSGALFADNVLRVGGMIDRNTTQVQSNNETAERSVYSFSVPGGMLGSNRQIRVVVFGTYTNASGATRTLRLRMKYGATTLCDKTSATIATNATAGDFRAEFVLMANNATNAQKGSQNLSIDRAGAIVGPIIDYGTAAIDSNSAQTFDITVTHSGLTTNFTKEGAYAILE